MTEKLCKKCGMPGEFYIGRNVCKKCIQKEAHINRRGKDYWQENEEKFGYLGDRAKCRICGRVYYFLGAHLKAHGVEEFQYKDEFEILHSLPLCVSDFSKWRKEDCVRLRYEGKIKTPKNFVTSIRNIGTKMPPAAKKTILQYIKNRIAVSDNTRKKMSMAAKNRTKETKDKIGKSVSKYYSKIAVYSKCDNCGKDFRIRKSKLNQKHHLCSRKCFREFVNNPKNLWLNHTKLKQK